MKGIKFNKTEESIFTLLSLAILIEQNFESLTGNEGIIEAGMDGIHNFRDVIDDTIYEALIYQILLKTCSYIDEWDKFFGVKTNHEDRSLIMEVKKISKPLRKQISSWKNLKDFRNYAIAHNHRDKEGQNIYLNPRNFNSPQSIDEIYLVVYCIKKMTLIVNFFFPQVAKNFHLVIRDELYSEQKFLSKEEIQNIIVKIETTIYKSLKQHQ